PLVQQPPLAVANLPLGEVEMESEAELAVLTRVGGGVTSRLPADHDAGTGDDPSFVGLHDAAVDRLAAAEVVRVDDQQPPAHTRRLSAASSPSCNQSWRCSRGGRQPRSSGTSARTERNSRQARIPFA